MKHIRRTIAVVPENGDDLRRLSATLRRLLIDGDLQKIASPRIGRIELLAPNNDPAFAMARSAYVIFFNSLGVRSEFMPPPDRPTDPPMSGIVRAYIALGTATQRLIPTYNNVETWMDGTPQPAGRFWRDKETKIDAFLSQKVICFHNRWVTRREVIKFAANVAGGVHTGDAKEDADVLLSRIRGYGTFQLRPTFHFRVDPGAEHQVPGSIVLPFQYAPDRIDPVLLEVLAAARYLTESPDVAKLEAAVDKELKA